LEAGSLPGFPGQLVPVYTTLPLRSHSWQCRLAPNIHGSPLIPKNLPFWHQEKQPKMPKEFVQSWQVPFKFRSKFLLWVDTRGTQGPNLKTIQKIRTSIAGAFDPSSHHMRFPFLVLPTLADPFLDPFAKWVRHVLVHFMTMCDRHPLQAQVLLREISKINVPESSARNGFRNAMYIRSNSMEGPFPG
jgi:hypothetical protein